ncbi:Uncharacterised protein [Mycobacteroides abscessus subsp. abscessus]|nr:Uncharacterised protein [Mycobacteroides abscessus subsp. abscessus]
MGEAILLSMTNAPGTAVPCRPPRTETELSNALTAGLLEETHFLDVKRQLPPSSSKANTELARDLAQFAIDGGVLVLGVDEVDSTSLRLHPFATEGICERIEQVAHMKVVPPLHVACHVLPAADSPGMGYVWVEVPASSSAPHMVDHTYYGRGDKTRHKLDDPEVERLHLARNVSADLAEDRLDAWVARDPYPSEQRLTARLYVVLEPVAPKPDMAGELLVDKTLRDLVVSAAQAASDQLDRTQVPDAQLYHAWGLAEDRYRYFRRPEGAALSTRWTMTEDHPITDHADDWEVELTDDGAVRVLHTGLGSVQHQDHHVLAPAVLVVVRQAISIAAAVGARTGYRGRWLCGVEVNGTADARLPTDQWGRPIGGRFHDEPISQGDSRRTRTATMYELQYIPWLVAADLLTRITRSLGVSGLAVVEQILAAPPPGIVGGDG